MKIFYQLWSSKYLNPFSLNSAVKLAGKSQSIIRNLDSVRRSLYIARPLAYDTRWRPCLQTIGTTSYFGNSSNVRVYTARKFHGNNFVALSQKEKKPETLQELIEATEEPQAAVTVGQKVAQAGKDVSYFAIMLAGFAVTGTLLWYVFSELFLSSSPNKIYADALKKLKQNEEVIEAIGEPIKGYGEETSRGRRRHVSFQEYIVAGENYMRVKFYVAGNHRKGTVHVDVKQVSSRKYEYRFIFLELDGFPPRTIVIEDNR